MSGRRAFIFNDLYRSTACYVKIVGLMNAMSAYGAQPFSDLVTKIIPVVRWMRDSAPSIVKPHLNALCEEMDGALRHLKIFEKNRPGKSLAVDGGIASVERCVNH